MSRYQTVDLSKVKTYPIADRKSKVDREAFAMPVDSTASFAEFWNSLPDYLAVKELRELTMRILSARGKHPIIWMMGAHSLKVGLSPVYIDLLERGFINCLASHGAFAVHDIEIALFGCTSEEVNDTLKDGRFGMVRETGEFFTTALKEAKQKNLGLGEALGEHLLRVNAPYASDSLLVRCLQKEVPLTIHVGIGTDIVHEHPGLAAEILGECSYRDFKILCHTVSKLDGGVVLNIGSAVIMPEVFLKALAVARNLGHGCRDFWAANFDMIQHYRSLQNVVKRPTSTGGRGLTFTGHHEIMMPLLAAALVHSSG